jgi:hypothetical protein
MVNGLIDISVDFFFTSCPSHYKTRGHPLKLFVKNSRLNCRKNFFSQRTVPLWNRLPVGVVSASSVSRFKVSLDQYFVDNDIW